MMVRMSAAAFGISVINWRKVHNRISEKLTAAFSYEYGYNPNPAEVNSWRNSLRAASQIVDSANLDDHGIILGIPTADDFKAVGLHGCRP